jgi:hypothetical protein
MGDLPEKDGVTTNAVDGDSSSTQWCVSGSHCIGDEADDVVLEFCVESGMKCWKDSSRGCG